MIVTHTLVHSVSNHLFSRYHYKFISVGRLLNLQLEASAAVPTLNGKRELVFTAGAGEEALVAVVHQLVVADAETTSGLLFTEGVNVTNIAVVANEDTTAVLVDQSAVALQRESQVTAVVATNQEHVGVSANLLDGLVLEVGAFSIDLHGKVVLGVNRSSLLLVVLLVILLVLLVVLNVLLVVLLVVFFVLLVISGVLLVILLVIFFILLVVGVVVRAADVLEVGGVDGKRTTTLALVVTQVQVVLAVTVGAPLVAASVLVGYIVRRSELPVLVVGSVGDTDMAVVLEDKVLLGLVVLERAVVLDEVLNDRAVLVVDVDLVTDNRVRGEVEQAP